MPYTLKSGVIKYKDPDTGEYVGVDMVAGQGSGGGGGGTSDYNALTNKPKINSVTLSGNKSLSDLGIHGVPASGSTDQVLAKNSNDDYDLKWVNQSGGGGTSDYSDLTNKPQINSVTLTGNKSLSDIGAVSQSTLEAKDTYVTPEEFGAAGDGTTDDTTAIQNCINYAQTNKKSVRGLNRYKTTASITISGTYLDLYIKQISYSGNDYAVKVTGSYNNLRFDSLYCSNGSCVLVSKAGTYIGWNKIYGTRFYAYMHGVTLTNGSGESVYYCTFDIRAIKADNGNCINNGGGHAEENVFMNISCTAVNGWTVYRVGGRYYNLTMESDCMNGINVTSGTYSFYGCRYRELSDKIVYILNGDTSFSGGTLVKFVHSSSATCVFYLSSSDPIPYEAIDVSEDDTVESMLEADPIDYIGLSRFAYYKIIDAPIRIGNWDSPNGFAILGGRMIVTGGRKICVPSTEIEWTVTDSTYDMREAQFALNQGKFFPTKFTIGVDNCVIYLSDSYCAMGYSEFIVDQRNHTCVIYDSNSTTTPIFNGGSLGSGIYKLKAHCDPTSNALSENTRYVNKKLNDGTNYTWDIMRIDNNGGSVDLFYATPEDYGAVGDGTTDDSEAVQAACDAGHAVYFTSNKTYYLASTVTIDHDCHLFGGENATIKTKTPGGGTVNDGIFVTGTLKKTTTLTTDYSTIGTTANCGNKFTLTDMTGIAIGDIMVITATDQYYNYARSYYYLGATLMVSDIYDGHIYTSESMPWDIENTANVTVKIYSAPVAIVENLNFVSDLESTGAYRYVLLLKQCKNSTIKNCTFSNAVNGMRVDYSFNTNIDGLMLSKVKDDNTLPGDGYGIYITSCTNTIISRVNAICAQHAITLSGFEPSINTYIRNCDLSAECRGGGLNTHENAYNTVIEDCILGGASLYGTVILNRCKIFGNMRPGVACNVSIKGGHNPDWISYTFKDCIFENSQIYLTVSAAQNPIQSYDSIYGSIDIENCIGGELYYAPSITTTILSDTIKKLAIKNWTDCKEIYNNGVGKIRNLFISNSNFLQSYFINDHNNAHGLVISNIEYIELNNIDPATHKVYLNRTGYAECRTLPNGVTITLSSDNSSALFRLCGTNLSPNVADDFLVGSVSGNVGSALTRTVTDYATLAVNGSGNPVYTQGSNTTKCSFYPVGMFYVPEQSEVSISATIKNTGATDAATFAPMIALVDCATGLVAYRGSGTAVTATAAGASISHNRPVSAGQVVLAYFYCSTAVSGSETTFEDFAITCTPVFAAPIINTPYEAKRRTGNGTLTSIAGVNNIMCSESTFSVNYSVDYINNPIGLLPGASGVNF